MEVLRGAPARWPKPRQRAAILAEKIEPALRGRCAIGLPGKIRGIKMIAGDLDSRQPPLGKLLGQVLADNHVCLKKAQLRGGSIMCAETAEEPDQDQLRIWERIDPQLDRIARRAELDQSKALCPDILATPTENAQPTREHSTRLR